MLYGIKILDKTVAQQAAAIRCKYKRFTVSLERSSMKAKGMLQPTSRSDQYIVEIRYQLKKLPQIFVLKPELIKNCNDEDIPHIYPGKKLCLYQPKYKEFKFSDLIAETIIPWTSLWLYYYEIWHNTGKWLGGGEHVSLKK
jgi:hypothetical protein